MPAWGTGLVLPGYGFLLNNQLTDFNFTPQANTDPMNFNPGATDVAPGKRLRNSMAPTMSLRNPQQPLAAFGSPGGATIINTMLKVAINLVVSVNRGDISSNPPVRGGGRGGRQ